MRWMSRHGPPRVNVTPLIDVMMCLIVFFLVVGRLASRERPEVELPASRVGVEGERPEAIVLSIGADGRVRLEGADAPGGLLRERVARAIAARPGVPIEIRADRGLVYAAVSEAIEACRVGGAASVRLAVRDGGEP